MYCWLQYIWDAREDVGGSAENSRTWGTRPCAFLSAGLSPATRVGGGTESFLQMMWKVFSNFNVHTSPQNTDSIGLGGDLEMLHSEQAPRVVLMLLVINHTLNSEDGKMSGNENDISCIPQAAEKLIPPASWKHLLTEPCRPQAVSSGHQKL